MARKTALMLLLLVCVLAAAGTASASSPPPTSDLVPVIVQFKPPPALAAADRGPDVVKQAVRDADGDRGRLSGEVSGLSVRRDFRMLFNGVAANMSRADVERTRDLPFVAAVFDDKAMRVELNQSVPLIGATDVWAQLGVTGAGLRIAVVDTGVDYTHLDLGGCFGPLCKVMGGYDFINNDADPSDDYGHGTHVAGIAAANGVVKGVAPDARILAYKVIDAYGFGLESGIIAGIETAVDPDANPATDDGADVINLSLGGPGNPDDPLSQAVDNAVNAGSVVVVAAGNSGPMPESIGSPGTARKAITVGATDKADNLASFSSLGPVVWDGGAIFKPDIVAPGVNICSSRWDGVLPGNTCINSQHIAVSGTSMAAPHVAGAAALLLGAHPTWTPPDVKAALRNAALNLNQDRNSQGYGRLRVLPAAQLPHAPPEASIATSGRLTGVTDIHGTAAGSQFSGYTLEVGTGMNPQNWSLVQQASTPIVDGVLKTGLDPSGLVEGFHTLRLTVNSTDGLMSEDRVLIDIDNVRIDSPLNNDILRKGGIISIDGSVLGGSGFQSYSLYWGSTAVSTPPDPSQWSSAGITLTSGGTTPIANGTLAQWNTAVVSGGNYFSLRLVVTNTWGQTTEYVRNVHLDPTLKAGWPQRVPWDPVPCPFGAPIAPRFFSPPPRRHAATTTSGALTTFSRGDPEFTSLAAQCSYWGGFLEPVVDDLDGDGNKEVVVYRGGDPPEVRAYRPDGSLLWSVPLGTAAVPGGNLPIPLIVDLDNNGQKEVVVYLPQFTPPYTTGVLYAIRSDGTVAPGWPLTMPLDFRPSLVAADLDGNGTTEIIYEGNSATPRQMIVVNGQGGIVSSWNLEPKYWGGFIESSPAVANLDADPQLEIVSADPSELAGFDFNTGQWNNTGVIYVYNPDGSIVPGWPVYTDGVIFDSPAIGDIDDNGQNDIVVGLGYQSSVYPDTRYGGIYAFGQAGNALPGWPFAKGENFVSSPALGDLDGDGDLEIAASRLGSTTYLLQHNGTVAPGWPKYTAWEDVYSTIIADVSGDGQPDVLTTSGGGEFGGGVYAWGSNGVTVSGFPKLTEQDAEAPATVANIDADGAVELAASSDFDWDELNFALKGRGSVYVWDLTVPYAGASTHWGQFHHDARHSGRHCRPTASGGPEDPSTCDLGALGYFHPVTPYRVLDTRSGPTAVPAGKVPPNGVITVDVTGGPSGVPTTGVSAVVLNATVTDPTAASYLTVYPSGSPRPLASNLNFTAGQTIPNLVTVKVGLDGNLKVYNAAGSTHVIFDVVGWYGGAAGGSRFNSLAPFRILDTRTSPQGTPAGKMGAGGTITVDVTGVSGSMVPANGVSAVVVNATVTDPTTAGYLTVYPSGAPRPLASNLNFSAGQTVPNLVTVGVGVDGNVKVYNAAGQTHVIFDVVGWYGASGDRFHPLAPSRILDTRTSPQSVPPGKVGSNANVTVDATGISIVPLTLISSVVVNTTVTGPTEPSYLTVYPSGLSRPVASNLNFSAGQTVPNLVIVKIGASDGNVKVYNAAGQTHVIFDAVGYFGP